MSPLDAGLIFVLATVAYLIGKKRGYRKGWRWGYREGWVKRERYGNGGRRAWQNRKVIRPKGAPKSEFWDRWQ